MLTFALLTLALHAAHGATPPVAKLPDLQPFEKNAVIAGTLAAKSGCGAEPSQVFLSVGQTLLHQVEVPTGASFEFHVIPGKYDVVAMDRTGCVAHETVKVGEKQTEKLGLKLALDLEGGKK